MLVFAVMVHMLKYALMGQAPSRHGGDDAIGPHPAHAAVKKIRNVQAAIGPHGYPERIAEDGLSRQTAIAGRGQAP